MNPTRTLSGKPIEVDEHGRSLMPPSPYALAILSGLQSMRVYQGTVPWRTVVERRRRNKAARLSRRANRKG